MHFDVKSLKNKHTKIIKKVRVKDSRLGWWVGGRGGEGGVGGWVSTGDFHIDLYAKI